MNAKVFVKIFRISGLMVLAFIMLSFSKEKSNRDLDNFKLKGKVKSFQEMRQSLDTTDGKALVFVYNKVVRRFNEQGNITEVLVYNSGDTLIRKETDLYRSDGQKRVSMVQDLVRHSRKKLRTYFYDMHGKLKKLTYFGPTGLKISASDYDSLGNVSHVKQFFRHSGLVHASEVSYHFNYDASGRLIQQFETNADSSLVQKSIFKYDKKGNKVETDIYDTDSSLTRRISAQYDTLGNPVDISDAYFFKGGDLGQKSIDIYDDNGFKIEEDTYRIKADNTLVLVRSIVYENDRQGNWVKETSFNNSKKGAVATRIIEYY